MKDRNERQPAKIEWEGDSKEVLSGFPHDVKVDTGILVAADSEWEWPSLLASPDDLSREGRVGTERR